MYLVKTPQIIQNLLPNYTWRVSTAQKALYLTFDDGPHPRVTPWVLNQLKAFNASATFFCVGENIARFPDMARELTSAGHAVGNHTHNHLNAWTSDSMAYFKNVLHCAKLVKSSLFRPPYGKLLPHQARYLMRRFEIVMWDVLSADFDPGISPEHCLANVLNNSRNGSIIVFHDSVKAWENLHYALPKVLEHFASRGYQFLNLGTRSVNDQQPSTTSYSNF